MLTLSSLVRTRLKLTTVAFALSAGLVACGDDTSTTPGTNNQYTITVNFTGVSGTQNITVTYPNKTSAAFNMQSGGIVNVGAAGTYTVAAPAAGGKAAPAAKTVTLTEASKTAKVEFAY